MPLVAARWMADGKTSLEDCEALTWSLGWTLRPSFSVARLASTSLAFMFEDVPDPVWKTSIGKCSSHVPSATSVAASAMAFAMSFSMVFWRPLTVAAAPLIRARAWIRLRSLRIPEIGKFSTARCVCAPHLAWAGTRTSPIESLSVLYA